MSDSKSSKTIVNGVIFERDEPRAWGRWLAWGGGAAACIAVVVGLLIWKPWHTEPPRLNEPPVKVAKFAISSNLSDLPFDRQVVYLKHLDDHEKEMVEAYRAGQMSEADYAKALQAAYLGRHIRRMENFHERRTPAERDAYLDRLMSKKDAEKSGTVWTKKDGTKEVLSPDAKDSDDVKHIKRDQSQEAATIQSWPAEVQKQWAEYHQAWEERKRVKKEREETQGKTRAQPGPPS